MTDYTWVSRDEELSELIPRWMAQDFVAIDTEFERTNTYFAKPGLIQIADAEGVVLIDPLAVSSLHPLAELMAQEQVVLVMHSMSEDVELLRHVTGQAPVNVFDTQIAAAFLGYGDSLGYQNLVHQVLDVELDKSETRSDWLQRPLSETQLSYAVKDAEYLCLLYDRLSVALGAKSLSEACREETRFQVSQIMQSWDKPELAYLKLRGAWNLSQFRQSVLQGLVSWRDRVAREKNRPKPWIFNDAKLIQIAERLPASEAELKRIKDLTPKSVQRYGSAIIGIIEDVKVQHEADLDGREAFTRIDAPIRGTELETYRRLKNCVAKAEEQSGISRQLLGSRKMLEQLVIQLQRKKQKTLPVNFEGWRWSYLAESFGRVFAEKGIEID